MKKNILLIAAMITAGATFAQDLTSKKGTPILPESGDYAIGFDAANLVNYAGNLFNGAAGNSAGNLNLMNTNTIYGKYFVDANTAYRGMVRLGFGTTTNRAIVASATDPNGTVEDEQKQNSMNITIGGGIEMRRGKGRLQGVYGPMAMISLGSSKTEYTYGNSLSATNTTHTSSFGQTAGLTENKQGGTFAFSVGGFGGVEYFFAPKISVGAEISWLISLSSQGDGETTIESWNGTAAASTTTETGGSSSFGFDVNPNGVISLNFHF